MEQREFDMLILGGGIAGLTAGIYAARQGKKACVLEKALCGGQILLAERIENYPGFSDISGYELAARMEEQAKICGVRIENGEAVRIHCLPEGNFRVETEDKDVSWFGKRIILATGTVCRKLGVEGEEEMTGAGVSYCAVCDGAFFRGKNVAVVGGGNTAFQDAIYLSGLCEQVYLVHRRQQFRAEQVLVDRARALPNVKFLTDRVVTKMAGEGVLSGILLRDPEGTETFLKVEGVFAAAGRIPLDIPCTEPLEKDDGGYYVTDENCQTNVKGIFAAGDIRSKKLRQLITAAADGATAASAQE